jgi:hypothetical protein
MALACVAVWAQSAAEKDAVAAVQKLFDAMAAHDGAAIRAVVLPEARLYAVRDEGAPTVVTAADFAERIGGMQGGIVERFTAKPKVDIRGRMAQVWGEYEFLRDGKFNHCGVDSVSLFQTPEGWKIAAIAYTTETKGCR